MHIRNRDPDWLVALYPWTVIAFVLFSVHILLGS